MDQQRLRTRKLVSVILWIISAAVCGEALTIDNQLVSTKNDCFDRIVLGAMLPFEKSFRNVDMNSLTGCKELCSREGEKCKTIAFGISSRGNGTCQLSSEILDKSRPRPIGTLFEPDFDIYERKSDCIDLPADDINQSTTGGYRPPSEDRPGSSRPPPPPYGTITTINSLPPSTSLSTTPFNGYTGPVDDRFSSSPPEQFPTNDRNGRYPTSSSQYPSTEYDRKPTSGYDVNEGGYTRPFENSFPTGQTPYNDRNEDKIHYAQGGYPLYKYPMLYEQNYPAPNKDNKYPETYAQNIPTLEDRYKPGLSNGDKYGDRPNTTPRPYFGMGYGNGYSYGTPIKYGSSVRPTSSTYGSSDRDRPSSPYDSGQRPTSTYGEANRPSTRPGANRPLPDTQYAYRPEPEYIDDRPTSNSPDGYGSRPGSAHNPISRPTDGYGPDRLPPSLRPQPQDNIRPGYGSTPEGNYHATESPIETYFNPDDYLELKWTAEPGNYNNGGYGSRYPSDNLSRACFRRVLAGKRIAQHWVRRTLACERVEDCMQECGHEKRFMCEGFNYRIDPSGHGQGDCELIEVPLSQMDLYSSPHNRDSNLLRHPDYDYYERDRNAPSSCRQGCTDCGSKPFSPADYYRPDPKPYPDDHFPPSPPSGLGGYAPRPELFRPGDTAIDKYRPSPPIYDSRPPPDYHHSYDGSISSHSFSSSYDGGYRGSNYGSAIDRYDVNRPDDYRPPSRWEVQLPSGHGSGSGYEVHDRPEPFRPPYRPGSDYSPYRPDHREPDRYFPPSSSSYEYADRGRGRYDHNSRFVPYLIGEDKSWGSYGGSYGRGSSSFSKNTDYWGLRGENRRNDVGGNFNYFDLGGHGKYDYHGDNFVWNYADSKRGHDDKFAPPRDRPNYGSQWTRRPGADECSAKSGEGFRLHKAVVRLSYRVPTITECERMCYSENEFSCHTYSYRYTTSGRDNCLLCDRPFNLLDYYIDIEPDRDYDIYSMADDIKICSYPSPGSTAVSSPKNNAQCFFRAIDSTRFFKSIVRDSLNVRSVGECELECIKSSKFTCRAFAFRYGQRTPGGIIDNCQLSDWPVRDMDKERHLILDQTFDVFERASYGHGCEIQPIVDEKHKKLCYLGYGSAAKLLPAAIKKSISVPTELECKNECIRYRESSGFKCYSFSFGTHASTFNCEMSDLDQTELKINVHYRHTNDRDYWLFAWNPFDWTCRDKVTTIGGNRANNDRRMDIFREPGEVTWSHYTVSGKPCRLGSGCEKNLITGFYSCEMDSGEVSSWDYCCKSDHPCGYSRGFEYPWCFVGDELDQWRKCSDRYFPGNKTELHLSLTHAPNDKRKLEHFQRPPRPGGLQSLTEFTVARLWPVTYLYSEGPPNSTELSNFVDCNKETC